MPSLRGSSSQRQTRVGGERAIESSAADEADSELHARAERLAESVVSVSPHGKVTLEELASDVRAHDEVCAPPMARGALQLSGMGITSLLHVEQHWQVARGLRRPSRRRPRH